MRVLISLTAAATLKPALREITGKDRYRVWTAGVREQNGTVRQNELETGRVVS